MDSGCDCTHSVLYKKVDRKGQKMNDTTIHITFKDGTKEIIDCCYYEVKNGCLSIQIRFSKTMVFPLDNIKFFEIY